MYVLTQVCNVPQNVPGGSDFSKSTLDLMSQVISPTLPAEHSRMMLSLWKGTACPPTRKLVFSVCLILVLLKLFMISRHNDAIVRADDRVFAELD